MSYRRRRTKWCLKSLPALLALLLYLALLPIQLLHLSHESPAFPSVQSAQVASFKTDCPAMLDTGGAASPEHHHDPTSCKFCRSLARLGTPFLQPFDDLLGLVQVSCLNFSFAHYLPFTSLPWAPFAPRGPPSIS